MMALLLDHLWQSSLFVAGAALLVFALRANGAPVRFWLWFAASMKFLVPFAALTALGVYLLPPIVAPAAAPAVKIVAPLAKPFSVSVPAMAIGPTAAPASPGASIVRARLAATPPFPLDAKRVLLAVWMLGFLTLVSRWLVRWLRVRVLLRGAVAMPVEAPVAVKLSASRLEPGLVGILRPVILLPQGIDQQLSPAELKAVLAHELCHWRRHDNLLAALHMLVEALFWFFPLVWWLGARLNAERERACDESVVAEGNDPERYAEGILKVCRAYLQSPLACVAGVSGAGLKQRIDTIMANRLSRQLTAMRRMLLGALASASVIAPLVLGLVVAPMAHVPAQAKAAVMSALNAKSATVEAPPAETSGAPEAKVIERQPSLPAETPIQVPEPQRVVADPVADMVVAPIQLAMNALPALPGSASAEEPKTRAICMNARVTGRVLSPQAIRLPGFACHRGGEDDHGSNILFGKAACIVEAGLARLPSCRDSVAMNVQLANPADAARMQPGMAVTLAGDFRVARQSHIDYLIVSNAKVLSVAPSAPVPGEKLSTFTCQPPQLIELSKQVGQNLCVQDEIVANLNAEGPALSTATHSFTRHPIRNTPVGGPDEITCRLGAQAGSRLPPPLTCARNSYWIAHASPTYPFGDPGPFNQPGNGGDMGPTQPGYVSGGIP